MDTTNVEAPIVKEEGGPIVREWPAADLTVTDDFRITKLHFAPIHASGESSA